MTAPHRPVTPPPHPSGATPPPLDPRFVPRHVAVVMDGNGRWANQRGLPRTEGHRAGEAALLDVVAGAVELGVGHVSAYAFSTENWSRSPEEVRFLMGFSRDVLRRQRDTLHSWNVRIRWNGRAPRLWTPVIRELREAEELTRDNTGTTLHMCVNYGSRAEILDGVQAIAEEVRAGRLRPKDITEQTITRHLDRAYRSGEHGIDPTPDVDLFLRTSGEQRLSNFLLWQSAYAELVFLDVLWPDVDRRTLYEAVLEYARRDRRYGGAVDRAGAQSVPAAPSASGTSGAGTGSEGPAGGA
ncbi:isoprenyl transferase [Micrococcus sp.]|uniref:isoprenyl transferase n=1 Tax=Micrococcus sp. TaxID=1271 RepID=UPI002A90ECC6|nr:isoprenyl transferase [Micrococcus sp.]MDY6055430.1 isoprenyl transferase [Micrococcus sp.]